MEKIIRNAIVKHMTENDLFSKAQHGFIKGKACVTQLLEFLEDISQAIDNGEDVDVVYLDFCKAFDKVPHKRLLKKLHGYGIRGRIYNWVKKFLSGREQRVFVNGAYSSKDVTSGIPQGSVLGPVLFLVFINDLPDVIEVLIKLFADDAKIYAVVSNQADNDKVQHSLNRAVNWADIWKMLFNIIKYHNLHVGKHDRATKYTLISNNQEIELEKVKNEKTFKLVLS